MMKWIDQQKPTLFSTYLRTVFLLLLVMSLGLFLYEVFEAPQHLSTAFIPGWL